MELVNQLQKMNEEAPAPAKERSKKDKKNEGQPGDAIENLQIVCNKVSYFISVLIKLSNFVFSTVGISQVPSTVFN